MRALALCFLAGCLAASAQTKLEKFLAQKLALSTAQLATLRTGQPIAVNVAGAVDREISVAGVIRIDRPAARTIDVIRNIETLESGKGFLHTRKLSAPPKLDDFAAFSVDKDDVNDLRKCRPGKCAVKLGKPAMDAVARLDWSAPTVASRVNELARKTAFDYVEAYRRGGNTELATYVDTDRPRFVAEEFADMIKRSNMLPDHLASLTGFLLGYPTAPRPKGTDDFYYWSVADFGLKPVFRLNHVVIHPVPPGTTTLYAIATKQLYATHYSQSALELRALVDDESHPGTAHYLVVLNMARSDGLTGTFGGLIKSKARSGSRNGLEAALRATKALAEKN